MNGIKSRILHQMSRFASISFTFNLCYVSQIRECTCGTSVDDWVHYDDILKLRFTWLRFCDQIIRMLKVVFELETTAPVTWCPSDDATEKRLFASWKCIQTLWRHLFIPVTLRETLRHSASLRRDIRLHICLSIVRI